MHTDKGDNMSTPHIAHQKDLDTGLDLSSGVMPTISKKETRKGSSFAFLAWTLAVFDFILFGTLLPRISETFGWNTDTSLWVSTAVTFGTLVVVIAVGPLVDRIGRRGGMMVTVGGTALSSLATAFTVGPGSLVGVRSVSGLGLSEQAVNATYLNELYELTEDKAIKKRKGFIYSLVQTGWPVGALLAAGFVIIVNAIFGEGEWRWVFAIATLPALFVLFLRRGLRETPQFQLQRAIRRLKKEGNESEARALAERFGVEYDVKTPLVQIFHKKYLRNTVVLSIAWILNYAGIQTFSVLGTTILEEVKGIDPATTLVVVVVSNIVGILGYLFHGWLGDKIGRKMTIVIGWFLGGICFTLMIFGPTSTIFVLITYMFGLFFLLGPYAAIMFYQAECYDTDCRATGTAFITSMGQPGALVGSFLLAALTPTFGSLGPAAFLVGALGTSLGGLCVLLARRVTPQNDPSLV